MDRTFLRRSLTWIVATVLLVTAAVVLAIVWTANEREWFVDSAGISLTLNMTLTTAGRWIATLALGGLMVICVAALAIGRAPMRRQIPTAIADVSSERAPVAPTTGQSFTYTPRGHSADAHSPQPTAEPAAYQSTVLGVGDTRRMEGSLPVGSDHPDPDATRTLPSRPRMPSSSPRKTMELHTRPDLDSGVRMQSTAPLRTGDRR